MKSYSYLLLLFIVFNLSLLAQKNENFLISIDLNKVNDLNKIEKLQLPVCHLFENTLITKVDAEKIVDLKTLKIDFDLIDQGLASSDYYLISPKNNSISNSIPASLNIVYDDKKSVIVKDPVSVELLRAEGFTQAKITDSPFIFKNEKVINSSRSIERDSVIAAVVSQVNADSVKFFIQSLQDFQTRFLFANTKDAVAEWIKSQFIRFGFTDVVIDSFLYQDTWQKNVVATISGNSEPEKVFVFGGHHDSYSSGNPISYAPGADDNASGTAAVLEMARVIKSSSYQPDATIKFITFGAEEYGLWGSRFYADYARNHEIEIRLMINHDMISHTSKILYESMVDINRYSGSEGWGDLAFNMVELYSELVPYYGSPNSSGSDSYSFWQKGYKAVYFEERDFSPFYHSPQDIITNYSMPYCAEVIRSSGALLLTAPKIPSEIQNFFVQDAGDGTSVRLSWSPNTQNDFIEYKIYLGTTSGNYNKTYSLNDTSFTIDSLSKGIQYFIAVSAVDTEGFESFLVERSIVPFSIPLSPSEFLVTPERQKIDLSWQKNKELDLAGYNIYRSETLNEGYLKINNSIYVDTFYSDNAVSSGQYYYYFLRAVDSHLNESFSSDTIKSRIISLDKGILLVDETNDGTGTILNPTDQQVDEFYDELLSSYSKTDFDILSDGAITLPELGAYSTVIWQAADNLNALDAQSAQLAIRDYLNYGGNFIYDGYRPTRAWQKNTSSAAKYTTGMFVYDYLKIDSSVNVFNSRFIGGLSINNNYPNIYVDSSKTLSADDYQLKGIESIFPNNQGTVVYKFETFFDSSSTQGKLKGTPVGVEYIESNYKSVVLSFPLYYMNFKSAKALIESILTNSFNEVTHAVDQQEGTIPVGYNLSQNYPNPFNPTTRINWQSPVSSRQTLKVFDVLGNEVKTLVNEEKEAGYHSIDFNAGDLPSGVYFYQLKADKFISTKKMLLLK